MATISATLENMEQEMTKPDHGGSQSSNQLVVQYEIMLHYPVICSQTRVNIYT